MSSFPASHFDFSGPGSCAQRLGRICRPLHGGCVVDVSIYLLNCRFSRYLIMAVALIDIQDQVKQFVGKPYCISPTTPSSITTSLMPLSFGIVPVMHSSFPRTLLVFHPSAPCRLTPCPGPPALSQDTLSHQRTVRNRSAEIRLNRPRDWSIQQKRNDPGQPKMVYNPHFSSSTETPSSIDYPGPVSAPGKERLVEVSIPH